MMMRIFIIQVHDPVIHLKGLLVYHLLSGNVRINEQRQKVHQRLICLQRVIHVRDESCSSRSLTHSDIQLEPELNLSLIVAINNQ